MKAIEVNDLRKVYATTKKAPGVLGSIKSLFKPEKAEVVAVKGVSFSIDQGEIVGFLGPNGAGKTTTLKMLSGVLYPTSGSAKVLGYTPSDRKHEMQRQISLVMGNKAQLWWDLPAWDSFVVQRDLYGIEPKLFKQRLDRLIETLQLSDKVNTQVRKLSLGERMKCELVAALVYSPRVIYLDEPTIGLDVVSQKKIREFLRDLHSEENCTIILTSHYMQDVEELCERVIVIDQGSLMFDGSLQALGEKFQDGRRIRLVLANQVAKGVLEGYGAVVEYNENQVTLEVPRAQTAQIAARVLSELPVEDISIEPVDIEEVIRTMFTK